MQNPQQEIDDRPAPAHTRVRALGSTEHLFWLLDQNRPTHFAMVAEIDRRFAPSAWHAAFQALQRRHPLLSTCIATDAQHNSAFHSVPGAVVPLRVIEHHATSWQTETAREIATRFDWATAPLVRATLLQRESTSTLILVAHHSVLDGMGAAYLIDELLRTLTGKPAAPLPAHPPSAAWGFVMLALGMALSLWRCPKTPAGFFAAMAFSFLLFFSFNKQAFANYYFLVIGASACAIVAATGNIYSGLWYPIVIAVMSLVVGLIFLPETKDRDISHID